MNKFYVYTHSRPDTNTIFYVGKGFNYRAYIRQNKSKYWNSIVNKNNGNYKIDYVAKNLTEKEAYALEIKLISQYGRVDLGTGILCNHTNGGDGTCGYKFSEEICKKRSLVKGSLHQMFGKKMSDESKRKMSLAKLGKPSPNIGRVVSKEVRDKIRKTLTGRISPKKGKSCPALFKPIINTITNEIVAIGIKDFFIKDFNKSKSIRTVANYLAGFKKKPVWFIYSYKDTLYVPKF